MDNHTKTCQSKRYGQGRLEQLFIAVLIVGLMVFVASCTQYHHTITKNDASYPIVSVHENFYNTPTITTTTEDKRVYAGTGTIIDGKLGLIVTAHHVVSSQNIKQIEITVGTYSYYGKVLIADEKNDIALVQTNFPIKFPSVVVSLTEIYIGDEVYTIGNTLGFQKLLSTGVISTYHLNRRDGFMITAPIYFGNSGGPVFNKDGHLIGIVISVQMADADGYMHDGKLITKSKIPIPHMTGVISIKAVIALLKLHDNIIPPHAHTAI